MQYDLEEGRGQSNWNDLSAGPATAHEKMQVGLTDAFRAPGAENRKDDAAKASRAACRSHYQWQDLAALAPLTETQSLIAMMLGAGNEPGEIARKLCVTPGTVRRHISVLKRHWGVKSVPALISRLARAQLMYERSRALYLFDEVLPVLTGARIEAPFLHEGEWCGLAVRLASGSIKKLWLMSDENEERAGWLRID
ncbi:helix-turn-helix transcriptional regulator [Pelagibacterium halotolerans]|uniref:HTH luxR-type domain-containing protein n=1 Tax=Pelagibacterium halotolerans (strain DSM 22347 / JCM 15775 / CGMCC 1.7692 / B2) TaxID=1082931 RepID=G4RDS4_PELHB|nr:hypothetical protein [Pelagibacterium halotolerans]AEQ52860.1 hypothetical protein KKY_2855 [Pelagibacterium halotolerans B2]QJR17460.1 hypothetical protein HKM20_02765 [Pelagibacterium halotolerans]SEA74603.1 regulatory protein, luxR family [Pelagibacterium halotolerans]